MKKEFNWNKKSVGYWSALGGVELKEISYDEDIDAYCYCVSGAWNGGYTYHRVKIQYNLKSEPYIRICGQRLYFEDCLRMGI